VDLKVQFSHSHLSYRAKGGPGVASSITVFNDAGSGSPVTYSDQIAIFGWQPLEGSVSGAPLSAMEVNFSEFEEGGCRSTMLSNDGVPTGPFEFSEGHVLVQGVGQSEWTEVLFTYITAACPDYYRLPDWYRLFRPAFPYFWNPWAL
jgi:hypothetical protein